MDERRGRSRLAASVGAVALTAALPGCSQEDADAFGEGLGELFAALALFLLVLVVGLVVLLGVGVALLVGGLRRLRRGPEAPVSAWVMVVVGAVLVVLPLLVLLGGSSSFDGGTEPMASGPDAVALPAGCEEAALEPQCEAVLAEAQSLLLPVGYEGAAEPVLLQVGETELVAVAGTTSDLGLRAASSSYLQGFLGAGWTWTNKPPCPPSPVGGPDPFCEDPFFFDPPRDQPLTLDFQHEPGGRAHVVLTPSGAPDSGNVLVEGRLVRPRQPGGR